MRTRNQVFSDAISAKPKLVNLSHYNEALGVELPLLPADKLGEFRLTNILRDRLGAGFRSHPVGSKVLQDFSRSLILSKKMR